MRRWTLRSPLMPVPALVSILNEPAWAAGFDVAPRGDAGLGVGNSQEVLGAGRATKHSRLSSSTSTSCACLNCLLFHSNQEHRGIFGPFGAVDVRQWTPSPSSWMPSSGLASTRASSAMVESGWRSRRRSATSITASWTGRRAGRAPGPRRLPGRPHKVKLLVDGLAQTGGVALLLCASWAGLGKV